MSSQEKIVELFVDLNGKIGGLTAEIRSVMNRLERGEKKFDDHERRIAALEMPRSVTNTQIIRRPSSRPQRQDISLVGHILKWGGWVIAGLIAIIMKLLNVSQPVINNQ